MQSSNVCPGAQFNISSGRVDGLAFPGVVDHFLDRAGVALLREASSGAQSYCSCSAARMRLIGVFVRSTWCSSSCSGADPGADVLPESANGDTLCTQPQVFHLHNAGSMLMLVAIWCSICRAATFDLLDCRAELSANCRCGSSLAFGWAFAIIGAACSNFHSLSPTPTLRRRPGASVILEGVLSRMVTTGSVRFCYPVPDPLALRAWIAPLAQHRYHYGCAGSARAIKHQVVVAYSSVAHLALSVLGFAPTAGHLLGRRSDGKPRAEHRALFLLGACFTPQASRLLSKSAACGSRFPYSLLCS